MKFGTFINLTEIKAKKCLKNSHYSGSYGHFKNAIFTRYALMNMLKSLLNSQFLCLWSHEMGENC